MRLWFDSERGITGANKCEKFPGTNGRGEARRAEFARSEGPRAWVGFLGRGSQPPPHQLGVWASDVSSPSGVWGGAPAEIEFDAFYL